MGEVINMEDSIGFFVGLLAAISIGLFAWSLIFTADQNNRFNAWSDECVKAGGFVFQSHVGFFTNQYTCHLTK